MIKVSKFFFNSEGDRIYLEKWKRWRQVYIKCKLPQYFKQDWHFILRQYLCKKMIKEWDRIRSWGNNISDGLDFPDCFPFLHLLPFCMTISKFTKFGILRWVESIDQFGNSYNFEPTKSSYKKNLAH